MRVDIPTEIKNNENRVAITQAGVVEELTRRGHDVFVQAGAGLGSAITDAEYIAAGATIVEGADQVWADSDMILKVKEPIASEYDKMRKGQVLFTYLHLAADRTLTDAVLASGTTAIAYETVQLANRGLPLLRPDVRGRWSTLGPGRRLLADEGKRRPRRPPRRRHRDPPRQDRRHRWRCCGRAGCTHRLRHGFRGHHHRHRDPPPEAAGRTSSTVVSRPAPRTPTTSPRHSRTLTLSSAPC